VVWAIATIMDAETWPAWFADVAAGIISYNELGAMYQAAKGARCIYHDERLKAVVEFSKILAAYAVLGYTGSPAAATATGFTLDRAQEALVKIFTNQNVRFPESWYDAPGPGWNMRLDY
jgi:hypothetical protein